MSTKCKLSDPTDAIRLYQSGLTLQEVGNQLGVDGVTILMTLRRAGVPTRGHGGPKPKRRLRVANPDGIIAAYASGIPEQQIAKDSGCSRCVIARLLTERGIQRRDVSQANTIRMQRMTPAERIALTAAAHDAVRGHPASADSKIKRALTESVVGNHIVPVESDLAVWLRQRGLSVSQQFAVGPYNLDVAINAPPIAIEIYGGGWHAYGSHLARHFERVKYLLDRGWSVVIVWVDGRRYPLRESVCDYLVALTDELRQDPSTPCQYRVILGDGQLASVRRTHLNDRAAIERLRSGR